MVNIPMLCALISAKRNSFFCKLFHHILRLTHFVNFIPVKFGIKNHLRKNSRSFKNWYDGHHLLSGLVWWGRNLKSCCCSHYAIIILLKSSSISVSLYNYSYLYRTEEDINTINIYLSLRNLIYAVVWTVN